MSKAFDRKLLEEARAFLAPWGIDWGKYSGGEIANLSEMVCQVTWTNIETGAKLRLSEIWAADDGAILQAGSNYGDLTL